MNFWFKFLNIHMNEKSITCHDCHGFKCQNIKIYQILIIFLCDPTPFRAYWIVTAPIDQSHVKLVEVVIVHIIVQQA